MVPLLFAALPLLLVLSLGCSSEPREFLPPSGPNVLLITVDTLRPDFLGAYGAKLGASPHLDALARESVVFERAIAASSRTAPSHASMMTSLYVREHSIAWLNGSSRLDDEWTLAEVFADAGYDTAAFVGNMMISIRVGLDAGFAIYDDDLQAVEINRPRIRQRDARDTTRRVLDWLRLERDVPYFLWVHYQDPHGPYTPPPNHARHFDLRKEGETRLPRLQMNRGKLGIPAYQALRDLEYPGDYASRYAGEIHFFDHWLGRLMAAVDDDSGGGGDVGADVDVDEAKPIVLLTADHGESFGEDGWWFSHGFRTTPDQIHVPFLLRAPTLEPDRRDDLVHHVDVAPTLLRLSGLAVPEPFRGLAIGDLLTERLPFPDRIVFADVGRETAAYQGDRFVRVENDEMQDFQWESTSRWHPVEPSERIRSAIERYIKLDPRPNPAETLDARAQKERLDQLRALGYVETGEDEETLP